MEYECPECRFVTPTKGEVSDPSFKPEKDYTYTEHTCPSCNTVLFTTRERGPHTRAINKLKSLLEVQTENPEDWPKVTPVIEPSSEKDMESILHLILQEQQIGFAFDVTGELFLGITNWKE